MQNEIYEDNLVEKIECYFCHERCNDCNDDDGKCNSCGFYPDGDNCKNCDYQSECIEFNIKITEEYNEAFYENCVIGCGYNSVEEFWEHSI